MQGQGGIPGAPSSGQFVLFLDSVHSQWSQSNFLSFAIRRGKKDLKML